MQCAKGTRNHETTISTRRFRDGVVVGWWWDGGLSVQIAYCRHKGDRGERVWRSTHSLICRIAPYLPNMSYISSADISYGKFLGGGEER